MPDIKSLFLLDPEIIFLNHGSFGATPAPVFEKYQALQRELENQPVAFLARKATPMLVEARESLAVFLGTLKENVVFIPNATFGVNVIARSLKLGPGDEVLATDHEYGACDNAWTVNCRQTGAKYIRQPISIPLRSTSEIVDEFWRGVTPNTRVIFISHITSVTAVIFPIKEICRRAGEAGILTLIDGAHAPGQIPLNLDETGADFYTGNCHKWLMSPKGAGFLYARPEAQHLVEPFVVGWGWSEAEAYSEGSRFIDNLQWLGTNDYSAYLSVPAAIRFQFDYHWETVRETCHRLLVDILHGINGITGLESVYPDDSFFRQMGTALLPDLADPIGLKSWLYEKHRIEVPLTRWCDKDMIRVSVQGYNSPQDGEQLLEALEKALNKQTNLFIN